MEDDGMVVILTFALGQCQFFFTRAMVITSRKCNEFRRRKVIRAPIAVGHIRQCYVHLQANRATPETLAAVK